MGWLDELTNGIKAGRDSVADWEAEQTKRVYNNRQDEISERNRQMSHKRDLESESDSSLLRKLNDIFTSSDDKIFIEQILHSRGYRKNSSGIWNR